jgi:hypothetical protein
MINNEEEESVSFSSLGLELCILFLKLGQLVLELLHLLLVLVLDSEVIHLHGDITHLSLQLVLFLTVGNNRIKLALESLELLIDFLGHLFLGIFVDDLFHFRIHLSNLLNNVDSLGTNLFDVIKNGSNVAILRLEILNGLIDSLQILIPIDILWRILPLILHIGEYGFLVLNLTQTLLELLLQRLDLVLLVLVLDSLVSNLLLLLKYLLIDRLLILFPLLLKLLKLIVELRNLLLQHSEILSIQLLQLTDDLLLLLVDFLF